MKIRATLLFAAVLLFLLTGTWGMLSFMAVRAEQERGRSADQLVASLRLAGQLRQSSDDLTRMARIYVSTGDRKYRDYFQRILAIRNADQPRPAQYGGFFWDRVLNGMTPSLEDGEPVALRELLRRVGVTEDEFALLSGAENNSNDLVNLEEIAMNAVAGLFQDQEGKFTRTGPPDFDLARSLMFGARYHAAKVKIMQPIEIFNQRVEARLRAEMERLHERSLRLGEWQRGIAFLTVALMAMGLVYLQTVIFKPLKALTLGADALRNREYGTRVEIGRRDEMGELGQTLNQMAEAIRDDIARRDRVAAELCEARQRAEQADQTKSEFLSRVSHELRTPLNGIVGFAQLLEIAGLPERFAEYARRIHKAGRHLLDLINEVLDISRIEAGNLSMSPEPVDVRELTREVIGLTEPMAHERGIAIRWEDAGAGEAGVSADRQRLRQVLLNLASNGIKYNREGGRLTFALVAAGAGRLRIEVRDTGHGIPPEQQDRLFTPFDRLDAEQSATPIEGTGLGLALSRKLVEAMGGKIIVASRPGEGSVFAVELERAVDLDSRRREQAEARSGNAPPPTAVGAPSHTILYVEDNPDNLTLMEEILVLRPQVKLLRAIQGGEGLDLARKHQPDLIFLDYHLPDINGDEVLRRLLADERTRAIPVYMLSADAMDKQIQRLKELGAADYLTKPLDVGRFLKLLDEKLK